MMKEPYLIGVYAADAGIKGELSYILRKVSGRKGCALCDITHGYNPLGKKEWKEACQTLPLPLRTLHLNQGTPQLKTLIPDEQAPAIAYICGEESRILVTSQELQGCNKSPQALLELIKKKLSGLHPTE
ncbi:hypothetical protein ACN082_00375 [Rothia sp. CCM 9417]|uniref:hypothetical protein n=1 Tax=Rothia sp. CCM 9417 TaxID=3402657 RepID=UPI003AD8017B